VNEKLLSSLNADITFEMMVPGIREGRNYGDGVAVPTYLPR
jgi:hypothetical protein